VLAELVSIGTLVVFAMVCAGVLVRWGPGSHEPKDAKPKLELAVPALAVYVDLYPSRVQIFILQCPCSLSCRRYYIHGSGEPLRPIWMRILSIVLTSIAFSLSFTERAPIAVPIIFLVIW
jgi:amino acid transporter